MSIDSISKINYAGGAFTRADIEKQQDSENKKLLLHLFNNKHKLCDTKESAELSENSINTFLGRIDIDHSGAISEEEVQAWIDSNEKVNGHKKGQFNAKTVFNTLKNFFGTKAEVSINSLKKDEKDSVKAAAWTPLNDGDSCIGNIIKNHYNVKPGTDEWQMVETAIMDANPLIYGENSKRAYLKGSTARRDRNIYPGDTIKLPGSFAPEASDKGTANEGKTENFFIESNITPEDNTNNGIKTQGAPVVPNDDGAKVISPANADPAPKPKNDNQDGSSNQNPPNQAVTGKDFYFDSDPSKIKVDIKTTVSSQKSNPQLQNLANDFQTKLDEWAKLSSQLNKVVNNLNGVYLLSKKSDVYEIKDMQTSITANSTWQGFYQPGENQIAVLATSGQKNMTSYNKYALAHELAHSLDFETEVNSGKKLTDSAAYKNNYAKDMELYNAGIKKYGSMKAYIKNLAAEKNISYSDTERLRIEVDYATKSHPIPEGGDYNRVENFGVIAGYLLEDLEGNAEIIKALFPNCSKYIESRLGLTSN